METELPDHFFSLLFLLRFHYLMQMRPREEVFLQGGPCWDQPHPGIYGCLGLQTAQGGGGPVERVSRAATQPWNTLLPARQAPRSSLRPKRALFPYFQRSEYQLSLAQARSPVPQ